jgi:hypothetical protein
MRSLLLSLFALLLMPAAVHAHSFGAPRVRGGNMSTPVEYGDFIYAAQGISIGIWNIADAARPAQIPFTPAERPPGVIFGLAVVGADLYVGWSDDARTTGGFQIYSLEDPAHPVRVGEVATMYRDALIVEGSYLYEVNGAEGVTVLDVADPEHPVEVGQSSGTNPVPSHVMSAQIAHGDLFVSGLSDYENDWAVVFDLADPAHPRSVATIDVGLYGMLGPVSDSGFAIALDNAGTVYDVRDLTRIYQVAVFPQIHDFARAAFRGDDLYLFGNASLGLWDFSSPNQPSSLGEPAIDTSDYASLTPMSSGFLVRTMSGRGIVIDASVPATPTLRAEVALPSAYPIADAVLDDRTVYANGEGNALEIIDASTLGNIGVLNSLSDSSGGTVQISSGAGVVGLAGSTAVIVDPETLWTIDVSDRAHPRVLGELALPSLGAAVVSGDRAYVSTPDGALAVVDLSEAASPSVRGAAPGPLGLLVAAAGPLAFVIGNDGAAETVHIIDASDKAHPFVAGNYAPCDLFVPLALAASRGGSTMAIVCPDQHVEIVDVRNPSAPRLETTYRPDDSSELIASIGADDSAFYLGSARGIDVVDASNPAAPVFVERLPTASTVNGIRLAPDGGALLALTAAGLYVFDCVASTGSPCPAGGTRTRPLHSHHARSR